MLVKYDGGSKLKKYKIYNIFNYISEIIETPVISSITITVAIINGRKS